MTTTKKRPEVLVPAGTLEKLKVAVNYGADAVFVGGQAYGLRSRAGNFTMMSFEKVSNTLTLVALMYTLLQTWLPMKEMKRVLVSGSVNCVIWDSMLLSYLTQP